MLPKVVLVGWMASGFRRELARVVPGGGNAIAALTTIDEEQIAHSVRSAVAVVTPALTANMVRDPRSLRLVQCPGVGTDRIAMESLPPWVTVANCRGHERAMVEYVVPSTITLRRRIWRADRLLRQGSWAAAGYGPEAPGTDLYGSRVLVLGGGASAVEIATVLGGLGADVLTLSRDPVGALARAPGIAWAGLADAKRHARDIDVLVVALPLTDGTRRFVSSSILRVLQRGATVIDISRGGVVDEDALFEAVRRGRVGGVAKDVWVGEPGHDERQHSPIPNDLAEHDNILVTPHLAGWSSRSRLARVQCVTANLSSLFRGEPLRSVVRPGLGSQSTNPIGP